MGRVARMFEAVVPTHSYVPWIWEVGRRHGDEARCSAWWTPVSLQQRPQLSGRLHYQSQGVEYTVEEGEEARVACRMPPRI